MPPRTPRSTGKSPAKLRGKLTPAPSKPPSPDVVNVTASGPTRAPCVRILTVGSPDAPVATLTYHLSEPAQAVQQILHLEVHPDHRRRGHATRLLNAAIADAQQLLQSQSNPARLRRVFAATAHKSHIPFRAVLTGLGFHHASTVTGLWKGEDLLIYIKSYT